MTRLALLAGLLLTAALAAAADDPPIETDGPVRITYRRDETGKVVAVRIQPISSCGPDCKCGQAAAALAADPLAQAVQRAARAEAGFSPDMAAKVALVYQALAARAQFAPVTGWAEFHDKQFVEAEALALLKGARVEVLKAVQPLPAADRAKAAAAFKTAGKAMAALAGGATPAADHGGH